jgi:LysR family transcriptional regulator, glycine cleavage system transcriptional activator
VDYRRELPSLSALAAFESAARHCNFTRAARELGTSQPAISRHVDNLETRLGCPLFERRGNRLTVTADGRRLYQTVLKAFEEIRATAQEVARGPKARAFTIACTYDMAHCCLMPRFARLREVLDGLEVQVTASEGAPRFDDQAVDLWISGSGLAGNGIDSRALFQEEIFPVCSPDFARKYEAVLRSESIERLLGLPLLHLSKESLGWGGWQTWFSAFKCEAPEPQTRLSYNNYVYLLEAAARGDGLALGWTKFVERQMAAGQLVAAVSRKVKTNFRYHAYWRRAAPAASHVARIARVLRAP